jgi:hypothetical protein
VLTGLIAVLQLGRLHPDEVYQFLEPAHFKAFGYGIVAWEWDLARGGGIRNWAIPGLFAGLLKACAALGIDDPWKRRAVLELPQAALHVWMLWAVYRLAARRVEPNLARWSIPLVGLYMPVLAFAGRTLGESFSAAFLVIGCSLLVPRAPAGPPPARSLINLFSIAGGALLGLSVVARYGSAAAVIGAMAWLLLTKRWRDFGLAAAGGIAVALGLGALDWATWGAPFHSLRAYLDFNVFSGRAAAQFGADPFYVYLPYLAMLAPWAWFGLLKKPSGVFVAAAVAYLLAIFLTAHKEPRFVYPALVLLSVAGAPGVLEWLGARGRLGLTAAACVASLPFFLLDTPLEAQRPEQFRMQAKAWPAATGFFIIPEGIWGAGGNFWLGKNIPWFTCDYPEDGRFQQAMRDPTYNRVVTWEKHGHDALLGAGFTVLEESGPARLYGR